MSQLDRGDYGGIADSPDEFDVMLAAIYPKLTATLTFYTGSFSIAEDIAQDTLTKAWQRKESVSQLDDPRLWIYRVAINRSRSTFRRLQTERRYLSRAQIGDATTFADIDLALTLRSALRRLSPRQRSAVVLRYYGELSVAETALVMECAQGTVKALTSQGVAALRSYLGGVQDEFRS